MSMIPYMVAGYAADRLMGGSGYTGLAIGTGVGGLQSGMLGAEGLGLGLEPVTMSDIGFGGSVGSDLAATSGGNFLSAYNAPVAGLDYPAYLSTAQTAPLGDVGLAEPLFAGVDPRMASLNTASPLANTVKPSAGGLLAGNTPDAGYAFNQYIPDITGKDITAGSYGLVNRIDQNQKLQEAKLAATAPKIPQLLPSDAQRKLAAGGNFKLLNVKRPRQLA